MGKYPPRSKLMRFEIVEKGDKVQIDISNENRPDTHITLDYDYLGEGIAFLIHALGQTIGIREREKKPLKSSSEVVPSHPLGVDQFQLHIAEDKSHVLLEFQTYNGLSFRFGMAPQQAEGIARKILSDLQIYPPPEKRH